jgi:uncharacterized OB-fold protein
VPVVEQLGGAPAMLEAIVGGAPGTLVLGADLDPPGAAAVLIGDSGAQLTAGGAVNRSLPVTTRDALGNTTDYADPRLLRERGLAVSLERAGEAGPFSVVAGLLGRAAGSLAASGAVDLVTTGASAPGFALAALAEAGAGGSILAVEQATVATAELSPGTVQVGRDERPASDEPATTFTPGADISISLSAYERAFEVKLRLEAGRCTSCGTHSAPPRFRCITCGSEAPVDIVALPREAVVHSQTTIHVPVPGKRTPYTLVIVQVGDTDVRLLVHLTGAAAGSTAIDDVGTLVFRRVAVRAGVPDYGYAFLPVDRTLSDSEKVAS